MTDFVSFQTHLDSISTKYYTVSFCFISEAWPLKLGEMTVLGSYLNYVSFSLILDVKLYHVSFYLIF